MASQLSVTIRIKGFEDPLTAYVGFKGFEDPLTAQEELGFWKEARAMDVKIEGAPAALSVTTTPRR